MRSSELNEASYRDIKTDVSLSHNIYLAEVLEVGVWDAMPLLRVPDCCIWTIMHRLVADVPEC